METRSGVTLIFLLSILVKPSRGDDVNGVSSLRGLFLLKFVNASRPIPFFILRDTYTNMEQPAAAELDARGDTSCDGDVCLAQ